MSWLETLRTLHDEGDCDFFLKSFSSEELDYFFAKANEKPFKKGDALSYKDDEGESLFVVLEGSVKIIDVSATGKETILNFIQPGGVVGEIAVFDRLPRTADAVAASDGSAAVLARRDVLSALKDHPELSLKIITLLCSKFRLASAMAADGWLLNMKSRLARALVRLGNHYGKEDENGSVAVGLKLSQSELGNYAGLSRENVNRQLKTWREQGLLSFKDGWLSIHDMDRMEDIAEADE